MKGGDTMRKPRKMAYGSKVFCPNCKSGKVFFRIDNKVFGCIACHTIFSIGNPGYEYKASKPIERKSVKKVATKKRADNAHGKRAAKKNKP